MRNQFELYSDVIFIHRVLECSNLQDFRETI